MQLQVNYLDWDDPVVEARRCMEVAAKHGVPVVIMEPARGGRLVELPQRVADVLRAADAPVSASALAEKFSVSRQIIVGDIALLRSSGEEILATPRGYVTPKEARGILRRVAVKHTPQEMEAELNAIVDNGCTVIDVIVDHPIYGQLTGPLQISNRYEVSQFIERCKKAEPLSSLTDGIHLHTLSCPDDAAFERTKSALRALRVLLEENGN